MSSSSGALMAGARIPLGFGKAAAQQNKVLFWALLQLSLSPTPEPRWGKLS